MLQPPVPLPPPWDFCMSCLLLPLHRYLLTAHLSAHCPFLGAAFPDLGQGQLSCFSSLLTPQTPHCSHSPSHDFIII